VTCPCGSSDLRVVADTGTRFDERFRIHACRRCGLRFPDRLPDVAELSRYYDGYGSYSDAAWLERELPRRQVQARRLLGRIRRLGPPAGPFLEVGCASGALLWNLAQIAPFPCHGLEVDPASAALARKLLPDRILTGTLESSRYPDGQFAVVYSDQVLEHVVDTGAHLDELRRVLAPGGLLLLGTPNFGGVGARLLGQDWKEFIPADHVRMFSPRSLGYHLRAHGFRSVRVTTGGLWLKRRDGKDLLPVPPTAWPVRLAARGLGLLGLGDVLQASARR